MMKIHKYIPVFSALSLLLIVTFFSVSGQAADNQVFNEFVAGASKYWRQAIVKDPKCLNNLNCEKICEIGRNFREDYPAEAWTDNNCRKTVIAHFLRMEINRLEAPAEVLQFIEQHAEHLKSPHVFTSIHYTTASTGNTEARYPKLDYLFLDVFLADGFWPLWIAKGNKTAILHTMEVKGIVEQNHDIMMRALKFWQIDEVNMNHYLAERYSWDVKDSAIIAFHKLLKAVGFDEAIVKKIHALSSDTREENVRRLSFSPAYKEIIRAENEISIANGDENAMRKKWEGLNYETFGYELNPTKAKEFLEELVKIQNPWAIRWKLSNFNLKLQGFEMEPSEAKALNEILVAKGDPEGIQNKFDGLCIERYGYKKNLSEAKTFIEDLVDKRNEKAISIKFSGLLNGEGSVWNKVYQKDPEAAVAFNEALVKEGNQNAISRKFHGLLTGDYRYNKNVEAAITFNENLVVLGDSQAIIRKLSGLRVGGNLVGGNLVGGSYGYEKNHDKLKDFISNILATKRDDMGAIIDHMELFYLGKPKEYDPSFSLRRAAIDYLAEAGWRPARYLKAFAMKQGIIGFEKNHAEYLRYIDLYQLAY